MSNDCSFSLDLRTVDHDPLDDGTEVWQCPHPVIDGGSHCLFHRDPSDVTDANVTERFLESVKSDDPRRRQFIGAQVDTLDLRYTRVEPPTNDPIVLAFADVDTVRLEEATLGPHIDVTGASIGYVDAEGVEFLGDLYCRGTTFRDNCLFQGATFAGDAYFRAASFDAPVSFWDADVNGTAYFRQTTFEDEVEFWNTTFDGIVSFREAHLGAGGTFEQATFGSATILEALRVDERTTFEGARFGSELTAGALTATAPISFVGARFAARCDFTDGVVEHLDFSECRFESSVDFNQLQVDTALVCRDATLDHRVNCRSVRCGAVRFSGASCRSSVDFDDVTIEGEFDLSHVEFHDTLTLAPSRANGDRLVNLTEARVTDGRLAQPDEGAVLYDLTGAHIGDVTLTAAENPFGYARIAETSFADFDFSKYRDDLRPAWDLHTVAISNVGSHGGSGLVQLDLDRLQGDHPDPESRPPGDLETTYLKAKNGAETVGDNTAAAEFFRKEMIYRRKQHAEVLTDADEPASARMRAAGRWVANLLLDVTAGYGERPWRVIVASVCTILAFTLVFASAAPSQSGHLIRSLALSIGAFVTLVLGTTGQTANPLMNVLAQLEGFIGAFFIALFVFTLTRSIHR